MKYDQDFCKPDENMRPLYCPLPLAVVIHHHDEWDEPVIDPETGEPGGETEHKTRDWDERRTEIFPTDEDKATMGYLPLSPDRPVDPPEGKHYERTDKIEPNGDADYKWVYVLVDNPQPPPRTFSKLKLYAAHPLFEQYFAAAKTALRVDDATAEAILSECVIE